MYRPSSNFRYITPGRDENFIWGNKLGEIDNKRTLPFAEEYWKEDGGHKWVEYIDATEHSLEAFNNVLLEHARIKLGESVLDVGCGGGVNSIEIAHRVGPDGEVRGVDISAPILNIARSRGSGCDNLDFLEGDAAAIDLPEDYFDLVFSRFGVMFFSDPVAAFKNLRKSIKPGGRMIFLCWRSLEENPWMGVPTQAVFSLFPPQGPPPAPDSPGPFSLAESNRINKILEHAGLKVNLVKAVDVAMKLRSLNETVDYFMKMGPGAAALADASDHQKEAAARAISDSIRQFEVNGVIRPPAAAWIVAAGK